LRSEPTLAVVQQDDAGFGFARELPNNHADVFAVHLIDATMVVFLEKAINYSPIIIANCR
jgi:hypothetical protein